MRKSSLFALAVLALAAACQKGGTEKKGPLVAEGNGIAVTAEEFKARIDEQSPFIRSRYTSIERKKEFLDNLLRFEVLAKEAQRQGLDKDPEVQLTVKKVMVQRLVQKSFGEAADALKAVGEAEAKTYYDQHRDEYVKPLRLRLYQIQLSAPAAGPERAKKQAAARKVLDQVRAEEKKNQLAFVSIAKEKSEDQASRGTGGDLGFKSREEVEKAWGKAAADAAFELKDGQTSGLVESPLGFHVFKVAGRQEAMERSFEQVKAQIAQKLFRERKTKEFDEFVKKLRDEAKLQVNDAELEKVAVAAAPAAPAPGAAPQQPPHGAPAPAPAAPAAAPAK
jgi:peptidyl-prolyl cis-trans isomerase C